MQQKETLFKYGSSSLVMERKHGSRRTLGWAPSLYAIVNHKNVTVASAIKEAGLNISFRRNLTGDRWLSWLDLVERLMDVHLIEEKDTFKLNLTESGQFSIKSLYA
jgi:hypothetical protein